MALVVIVGMWLAVGVVSFARRRAERGSTSSIGEFRRQLGIIGRTGPDLLVAPANRLRVPRPSATVVTLADPRARRSSSPGRPSAWAEPPDAGRRGAPRGSAPRRHPGRNPVNPAFGRPAPRSAAPTGRVPGGRRTLERRRTIFVALASITAGATVIGAVPGARVMWALAGITAITLAAYVGLLVRSRNAAAERELKLAYLPPPRRVSAEPMLRRSATN